MDSNDERVQKHVVDYSPGQRHEVLTERTERGPRESGLSRGTIVIVAILAITAIAIVLYLLSISNRLISISDRTGILILNRQESSTLSFVTWIVIGLVIGFIGNKILNKTGRGLGRDCLIGIVGAFVSGFLSNLLGKPGGSRLDLYSLLVAAVGAVVAMIVYHALFRRRRFLSMRFKQPTQRDIASDDANMQEVATRRLNDEAEMTAVSITISEARAILTGTVNSEATKAKAEQIVKAVRGVKSVDNQIVVSG
ncbi:MAG TPA: BON domain-containing protein [Pyrinomonadaceae bacterium]|nr:BON domain-containing protein [Pyrinomonadaceae bacterium]